MDIVMLQNFAAKNWLASFFSVFKSILISKKSLLKILSTANVFQLFNAAAGGVKPASPLVRTFDLSPEAVFRKSYLQVSFPFLLFLQVGLGKVTLSYFFYMWA